MPSARWNALQAVVDVLATITPGGPNAYIYDLSVPGVVHYGIATDEMRLQSTNAVDVQVEEDREDYNAPEISPGTLRRALFIVRLDCILRGDFDTHPRRRINDLLRDINVCIGLNPTLNSSVVRCVIARVDEPQYSPDERVCSIVVFLAIDYTYTAGVTF